MSTAKIDWAAKAIADRDAAATANAAKVAATLARREAGRAKLAPASPSTTWAGQASMDHEDSIF